MLAAVTFVVGLIVGWFGKSAISIQPKTTDAPSAQSATETKPKIPVTATNAAKDAEEKQAAWAKVKKFGDLLMHDTTLEDGPTFAYYDFVAKTDGLPSDQLLELLNQFYAASKDEKSGAVEEAVTAGIGCLIMRLSSADPKAAANWLMANMPDADDESMITQAWSTIAEKDPALMKSLIAGAKDEDLRTRLDNFRLASIGKTEPERAVNEIMQLLEKDSDVATAYTETASHMLISLGEKSPAQAAELAIKLESAGHYHDTALKEIMSNWSTKDPEASLRWALQLTGDAAARACQARLETNSSPEAIKQVAEAMQRWTNATAADKSAVADAEGTYHTTSLLDMVLQQMVTVDGIPATRDWMSRLADPKLKAVAETEFIKAWIDTDPVAASSHIAEMADSPEKNQAITKLVDQIVSTDPERAFAWARKISDDEKQQFQMESSMKSWLESDPISAAKTLEQMPPAFRERILRKTPVE